MKAAVRRKDESSMEPTELEHMTPRERDILRLVSMGNTSREIASILHISPRTVEVHRFNLRRKFNVRNLAQLLRVALRLELLAALTTSDRLSSNQALREGLGIMVAGTEVQQRGRP